MSWRVRAGGLSLLCLSLGGAACGEPAPAPPEEAPDAPWSLQLHVHGSMSEGDASWSWHSDQAARSRVDVLWWSDHDWMLSGHQAVSHFPFEEPPVPPGGGPPADWEARVSQISPDERCLGEPSDQAAEGLRSLQVSLREQAGRGNCTFQIERGMERARFSAAARPRYALSIRPAPGEWGPQSRLLLRFILSTHPAAPPPPGAPPELAQGIPAARYVLDYVFAGEAPPEGALRLARQDEVASLIQEVPLPLKPGEWTRIELDLAGDIARYFPWIDAEDNAIEAPVFGLISRNKAPLSALFDDYQVSVERIHQPLFERSKELAGRLQARYGGEVGSFVGMEVSLCEQHINVFTPTSVPEGDFRLLDPSETGPGCAEQVAAAIHALGGVVSYNHPFGINRSLELPFRTSKPSRMERVQESIAELSADRVYGADLLEVGYPARGGQGVLGHLFLWDALALQEGLFLTGTGVTDHHDASPWAELKNNFETWAWAPSPDRAELIRALRAGEVFFGPVTFEGALSVRLDKTPMGGVLWTDRGELPLWIEASGLSPGDEVVVVERHKEGGRRTRYPYPGDPALWKLQHLVDTSKDGLVRVEVWRGASPIALDELVDPGEPVAFSNPVYFLRELPAAGLPLDRGAISVLDLKLYDARRVQIERASIDSRWSGDVATLAGAAERPSLPGLFPPGSFQLDLPRAPRSVRLTGGSYTQYGETLQVTDLSGPFELQLIW